MSKYLGLVAERSFIAVEKPQIINMIVWKITWMLLKLHSKSSLILKNILLNIMVLENKNKI